MKCKTKDCKLEASAISMHDTPKVFLKGEAISYERTIKWRCLDMHLNLTSEEMAAVKPEPSEKVLSANRFKAKGFSGHVVKPHEVVLSHPPTLTNHQRHVMNQERKRQLKKMKQEAKV